VARAMLVSANRFSEGSAMHDMHVCLEPSLSVVTMKRRGLRYDGRYQPCCQASSRGRVSLYVLLSGELATSNGLESRTPALFRMSLDVFEGASGVRPATVRLTGEPMSSIALHVDRRRVAGDAPALPEQLPLSPELERAARAHMAAVEDGSDIRSTRQGLVAAFTREGLLLPYEEAPSPIARVYAEKMWSAISVHFARLDTAPTIATLADLAQVSPRTTDRLMKHFTDTYGLPAEGLRELSRRWRLKLATLLLSNPTLSVRRVAQRVGYRNAEALANALASEGLPNPSVYREI
jgi:AraC-like DNA-binding protein